MHDHTSLALTRPNVAGADGGVNRWRREHRHWRPLADLDGRPRIVGRARARAHARSNINAPRNAESARATLFGDRNTTEPEYTHQRRAHTRAYTHTRTHARAYAHERATHARRKAARIRQLHSAESIMDIRTDGPPGPPPSLPPPSPFPYQHRLTGVHRYTPTRSRQRRSDALRFPSPLPPPSFRSRRRRRYNVRD